MYIYIHLFWKLCCYCKDGNVDENGQKAVTSDTLLEALIDIGVALIVRDVSIYTYTYTYTYLPYIHTYIHTDIVLLISFSLTV